MQLHKLVRFSMLDRADAVPLAEGRRRGAPQSGPLFFADRGKKGGHVGVEDEVQSFGGDPTGPPAGPERDGRPDGTSTPGRQAMMLPWSNGQVEGLSHRLKLLKRQMYGRAKLDLLRARLMQVA